MKLTAKGGYTHYTDFTWNIVYDCIYDNITVVRSLPSSNARLGDMLMVGNHPVTYVNSTVGLIDYYSLDLRDIFTNNASFYCPRTSYEIVTVYNHSTNKIYSQD